jgi:Ca2+-binding EF-hand superfamily protein
MTSISSNSYQTSYQANIQKQLFKKIDTDGDGKVTKDEFVSSRPKNVDEKQASSLFDSIDKKKTGSLSESDFADAAPQQHNSGGLDQNLLAALLQGQDQSNTVNTNSSNDNGSDDKFADLFSKTDADKNGTVSKDEFVKARPKGVTEEQASSLYAKIDSTGSDALTSDQLKAGLEANRPAGGPPQLSSTDNSSSSSTTDIQSLIAALKTVLDDEKKNSSTDKSTTTNSAKETVEKFFKALKSYSISADYSNSTDATSLLATA